MPNRWSIGETHVNMAKGERERERERFIGSKSLTCSKHNQ